MTAKTVAKSRILKAVHETARDLNAAGFIDMRRMREYDALCLAPIPAYSRQKIRALRQRLPGRNSWRRNRNLATRSLDVSPAALFPDPAMLINTLPLLEARPT